MKQQDGSLIPRCRRVPLGALIILASGLGTAFAVPPEPRAYVIPIEGQVDAVMHGTIQRRLDRALRDHQPEFIFFSIDTYGGRVDAAETIAHLIDTTTGAKKVAFIHNKAISAGAFIAISCDEIVMHPRATIGDSQPIVQTVEGVRTADEKFESALRAKLVTYAEDRGYPGALAGAMVSPSYEVLRVPGQEGLEREFVLRSDLESWSEYELRQMKIVDQSDPLKDGPGERKFAVLLPDGTEAPLEVVVRKGELLTLNGEDAASYGFARFVASDFDEVLKLYGIARADVQTLPVLWWEGFVKILNSMPAKILLLALGLIGLFFELKMPGFGLPGILGLACFALLFFASHLAGLAQWIEIILFGIGIVLLALEIFVIPGFGVAGIAGIILVVGSLILALVSFSPLELPANAGKGWKELTEALTVVFAGFGSFFVAMMALIRFLPNTPIFGRLMQSASLGADRGFAAEVKDGSALEGRVGVALTVLRPAGKIEIDGSTYDAAAQGEFIERGDTVRVVDTAGNRIMVRKT